MWWLYRSRPPIPSTITQSCMRLWELKFTFGLCPSDHILLTYGNNPQTKGFKGGANIDQKLDRTNSILGYTSAYIYRKESITEEEHAAILFCSEHAVCTPSFQTRLTRTSGNLSISCFYRVSSSGSIRLNKILYGIPLQWNNAIWRIRSFMLERDYKMFRAN